MEECPKCGCKDLRISSAVRNGYLEKTIKCFKCGWVQNSADEYSWAKEYDKKRHK